MNSLYEHEIRYKILKLLAGDPNLSQRATAQRMGISLGKTNYVLSELAEKGIIKIKRFNDAQQKILYSYLLTPRGLEQKAKITAGFLKRKLAEYEEIKRQIKEIAEELKAEESLAVPDMILLKETAEI